MRYSLYLLTTLFIFALAFPAAAEDAPKDGEKKPGPLMVLRQPIDMDYGASRLLMVVFNHSDHKKFGCRFCHHKTPASGDLYAPCTTKGCHSIPGARERSKDSMFMAYHAPTKKRSCYGCHTNVASKRHPDFVGCFPCHGTLQGMTAAAKQEK